MKDAPQRDPWAPAPTQARYLRQEVGSAERERYTREEQKAETS